MKQRICFWAAKAVPTATIVIVLMQLSCNRHERNNGGVPAGIESTASAGVKESSTIDDAAITAIQQKRSTNGFGGPPTMAMVAANSIHDSIGKIHDDGANQKIKYESSKIPKVRRRLSPGENKVKIYISFDDGPHTLPIGIDANYTERIIDTLKSNSVQDGIKAAFFVQTHVRNRGGDAIGQSLITRLKQEGHVVGIHTGSSKDHVNHKIRVAYGSYDSNGDGIVDEKDGANALEGDMLRAAGRIAALTGEAPKYVRPTFGSFNGATEAVYSRNGLKMIRWDIDSEDSTNRFAAGARLAEVLRSRIRMKVQQGETEILVLFHDIKAGTQTYLDDYLIAMYEGAQDAGKIACFPTTTSELDDFLSRY